MISEKTLHAGVRLFFDYIWLEHGVDFEFTKRIKYQRYNGLFNDMYLEIEMPDEERRWTTFWKKTKFMVTVWVRSNEFENRYPHKKILESEIVVCE